MSIVSQKTEKTSSYLNNTTPWDDLHEECGVFGIYDFDGNAQAESELGEGNAL